MLPFLDHYICLVLFGVRKGRFPQDDFMEPFFITGRCYLFFPVK